MTIDVFVNLASQDSIVKRVNCVFLDFVYYQINTLKTFSHFSWLSVWWFTNNSKMRNDFFKWQNHLSLVIIRSFKSLTQVSSWGKTRCPFLMCIIPKLFLTLKNRALSVAGLHLSIHQTYSTSRDIHNTMLLLLAMQGTTFWAK